ncbi:MAG: hypothetical protein EOO81_13145, partial [Oxalobacteraceae bacterium]
MSATAECRAFTSVAAPQGRVCHAVIRPVVDFALVDLDNCHQEPIHIPGYIQPHGLLFALDFHGRLTHVSRGAHDT